MTIFYLLTFLVCGGYVVWMGSYLTGWHLTPRHFQKDEEKATVKCSVIIPVRNEEKNILKILGCLGRQLFPADSFEIIVVNDHSFDRTAEVVSTSEIFNLRYISLPESMAGKKQAIAEGVKKARGELIITTDADCEMGESWLSSIVSFYEKEKPKMIVAPVLLKDEKSLSEIIQSQEMTVLTASACASLYYNRPVLCSGANLVYEKEAFSTVNGFEGVNTTLTGDDVFLMLKFHKQFPEEIKYLKSKEAAVFTHPEKKPSDALSQRKRWASKTFRYGFNPIFWVALLVFGMNFFILISGILSVINIKFAFALVTALPLKCIADYMLLHSASSFFGKKKHVFVFILGSVLYPFYATFIGLIAPFTHYSWKSRTS